MNFGSGKVALVTGGANGIGKAITERLSASGVSVVIADVASSGESFCNELRAKGHQVAFMRVDVRSEAEVNGAVGLAEQQFGGLDILVNSAGIFPRATLEETTDEFWDKVMDVNLKGTFHACHAAVPAMRKRGAGVIINIGSLNTFGGQPDLFAYSTSKGGIASLTLNLARALAQYCIRVNCVHPGWVVTEGEKAVQRQLGMPDDWAEISKSKVPLGRLQTPEDIAATVAFMASDDASQITGQFLTVDGGMGFYF